MNSRTPCEVSSFQDWHVRPLRHPSKSPKPVMVNSHRVIEFDGQDSSVKITEQATNDQLRLTLSFADPFKPSHVLAQYIRYRDAAIRLLVLFHDGHERTSNGKSGPIERMDEL